MICPFRPDIFVDIQRIPVSVNGKRDQAAIDQLEVRLANGDGIASTSIQNHSKHLSGLELQLKQVWEEVMPKQNLRGLVVVDRSSDFFQVGGSLMSAIKLRSLVEARFGVKIPLIDFFQSSTLSTMTARIQNNDIATGEIIPGIKVDWNADVAALPLNLGPPFPDPPETEVLTNGNMKVNRARDGGLRIMLTGSTGFLGTEILRLLADNPAVLEIHFVAIRPKPDGLPRHVAVSTSKVFEYAGDLSEARLGLSEQTFRRLAATMDLVIHNGASVSFLKSYQTLRAPNVISTRSLADLCLVRRIPLHFISSAAVAGVRLRPEDLGNEATLKAP